jgi:sarcosine oxidase subunit beta
VLERVRATGLIVTGDRITGVSTPADTLTVGRSVIVACNAGVPELLASVGVTVPTFPVVPQVVVTEPAPPGLVRHLIGHAHRRLALKALPDGRLMITGGWLGNWDPQAQRGEVLADQVDANLAEAAAVFPQLAGVPVGVALADRVESIAPDMVPVIDRVPGIANAWFATGWSGHGWAIAPAVSELLVEWLLAGERPPALAPFALDRFASV